MTGMEKTLVVMICVLAGMILLLWFLLGKRIVTDPAKQTESFSAETAAPGRLTTPEDYLPQSLALGSRPPEAIFQDDSEEEVSLDELAGEAEKGVWLLFWASWCPDCEKQFEAIREMEALAARYKVSLVLVDRLDPKKESLAAAQKAISSMGTSARAVYDPGETVYKAWGMREIPSSVMLDPTGAVRGYAAGVLSAGSCEGLLKQATEGRDRVGMAFLEKQLSDGQGGIFTSKEESGESPGGRDVLSESQGLMLWYALARNDKALFDRTFRFVQNKMIDDGLAAWYVNDRKRAPVNATLDDLRLWYACHQGARKWGDDVYAAQAKETAKALLDKCVNDQGGLVDYSAMNGESQAQTISLCYLDLVCLRSLAGESEGFAPVAERAEQILKEGRISDAFPFYYASYDYGRRAYSQADLHTAEALYTLWNLSRAGELPRDTWAFLRSMIDEGQIAARYHPDGTAVQGFEYHSTAVWGLAALIAAEEEDGHAFELALRRMDRLWVLDTGEAAFGAYAQKGSDIFAFDQLIPLLVNAGIEEERLN